jgi:hypothetical protein
VNLRMVATVRGLVVFGVVWQVLWLLGDPTLRSSFAGDLSDPGILLILVSVAVWLGVLIALFGPRRNLDVARGLQVAAMVILAAAGLYQLAETVAGADGWYVGASVLNLAAGLAGVSMSRRWGLVTVGLIVIVEIAIVIFVHSSSGNDQDLLVALIYPFYALALGLACVGARHGLIRSARAQDASASELERQQQARATSEFMDASIGAAETRLHETVLNTLTAIERGGFGEDEATSARLRERAAESAEVLRMIADGAVGTDTWTGDLRVDLAGAIVDLENAGIAVHLDGVLDVETFGENVRSEVLAGLGSAVREALINVLRHSQAKSVTVRGEVLSAAESDAWKVEVSDNGRGIGNSPPGFGLRSIIGERIGAVGGRSAIRTNRRNGTRVTLVAPLAGAASKHVKEASPPLESVGRPMVTAFTLFTLYSVIATARFVVEPLPNVVALMIFMGVASMLVFVTWSGRFSQMPPWASAVTLIAVPLMTQIEAQAQAIPNPTGDWSSELGAAFLFVVVATGSAWVGPLAVISWFIAQDSQIIELLQPGTVVIIVAMFMGWQLRRGQANIRSARSEAGLERVALAAARERVANARRRYADVDTSGVISVLDAIAQGTVDPRDRAVQEVCRREERMIRSVMRLHPERLPTHLDLVRLAVCARDRGVELNIVATDEVSVDRDLEASHRAQRLIGMARPGSSARATLTRHGSDVSFTFVVQVPLDRLVEVASIGEIVDDVQGIVSIEEQWTDSSRVSRRHRTPSGHGSHVT